MTETVVGAIIPSVLVGLVLFYWERRQQKNDRHNKLHEDLAIEGDLVRLDLEVATAKLAYAVAMAVQRGKPNGEMEEALKRYHEAMDKFRKFERKQIAINGRE